MTSPNLAITHVATNQAQPQVVVNEAIDALDNAMNEAILLSGGAIVSGVVTYTVSADDYRSHFLLMIPAGTNRPVVTVPSGIKRTFCVLNQDDAEATVQLPGGSESVTVPGQTAALIHSRGTNLERVSGGGGGGGGGGTATSADLVRTLEGASYTSRLRESRTRPSDEGFVLYENDTANAGGPTGAILPIAIHPGSAVSETVLIAPIERFTHFVFEVLRGPSDIAITTGFFDTTALQGGSIVTFQLTPAFSASSPIFLWVFRNSANGLRVFITDENTPDVATNQVALRRVIGYRSYDGLVRTRPVYGAISASFTPTSLVTIYGADSFSRGPVVRAYDGAVAPGATDTAIFTLPEEMVGIETPVLNQMSAAKLKLMTLRRYALLGSTQAAAAAFATEGEYVDLYPGEEAVCLAVPRSADPATGPFTGSGAANSNYVGRVIGLVRGPRVEYQIAGVAPSGPVRGLNFRTS